MKSIYTYLGLIIISILLWLTLFFNISNILGWILIAAMLIGSFVNRNKKPNRMEIIVILLAFVNIVVWFIVSQVIF